VRALPVMRYQLLATDLVDELRLLVTRHVRDGEVRTGSFAPCHPNG
jgi:hypothetical protein